MSYEAEQERLRRLMEECFADDENIEYDDEEETNEHDNVETREGSSDTEQEFDSEDDEAPDFVGPFFMGKDGITKWGKHPTPKAVRTRAKNICTQLPGVKAPVRGIQHALEIWKKFFDTEMLAMIVENTNKYMASVADNYARETYTRPTNLHELQALCGILLLSGVKKCNHLNAEDLFKSNGTVPEIFRMTMCLQRFRFLLRFLRFDDLETREARKSLDKLAPIRDFFAKFVENCKKNYSLGQQVTIDEKLEGFRGRCSFRQYIPSKPNKYGIKIFALCDAKMYYTANLEVYVGTQPEGPFQTNNSALSLVERLCQPIYGTGRNLTTDNWFTSFPLAELLLRHKLTTIGTIKRNKRELPQQFAEGKSRPIGSSMFGFKENCTLVSYIPKKNKNVLLISTMHDDDEIDDVTGKPDIIMAYNNTKGGVDTVDQLCANYNCARNARRWQMVVFYSILNISGINSQVIYNANNPNKNTLRRHFLEDLSFALINDHLKVRAQSQYIPRNMRNRIREICSLAAEEPNENAERREAGRCFCCSSKKNRKTRYFCKKCKTYLCLEHSTIVCSDCYRQYSDN